MNTRDFLLACAAVVVMALFVGYINNPDDTATSELKTIKIGVFPGSPNAHYPIYIAEKEGYFAEAGLDVEIVEIYPGLSVAALIAGELDYAQYLREVVSAALEGAPVKVVAVYPNEPAFALVAQTDISKEDINSIGVNFKNDANHYHALETMAQVGKEVEVTTSNSLSLLAAGNVDAVVLNLADPFELANEGYQIIELIESDIVSGFTALTETVQNNPEEVAAVIAARERAFEFMRTEPEKAKAYLAEVIETKDMAVAEGIYTVMMTRSFDNRDPTEAVETLVKIAKAGPYNTFADIESQEVTQADVDGAFDFSALTMSYER